MKTCFRCLTPHPLNAFYKHSRMRDGHLNKCIECTKADVNAHRQANLERVRSYDQMRGSMPHRIAARREYQQTEAGRMALRRALKASRAKFPLRAKARDALNNAVRDGKVIPWPVCAVPECARSPEAHHADYSRPLDVVWLCQAHHKQAHALTRKAA